MDCGMPGFPVFHYLLEFAQIRVQWVGDVIQPSHSLSTPSPACPQSSPASGSSLMSRLFTSSGQSIGASVSASVLPVNIQKWFPLRLTGLISLQSKGLSSIFSNTTVQKHQFFSAQLSLWSNSHIHTSLLEKTIALTRWTFFGKVISLLFNMLSRLDIAFLPRRKRLLISWLQSLSAVILDLFPLFPHTFAMKWWDWIPWP